MPGEPNISRSTSSQDRKRKQSPISTAMPEAPVASSSVTPGYQQSTITEHFTPKSQATAYKRSKTNNEETNHAPSTPSKVQMKPITKAAMLNFGNKSDPIDLTTPPPQPKSKGPIKPPPFQTHAGGTKKLKVKNLRPQEKNKAEIYFNTTWATLDSAVSAIFSRQMINGSMEELYRGVENVCRSDRAAPLYKKLEVRCDEYVRTEVRPGIMRKIASGVDAMGVARVVEAAWQQWSRQLNLIGSIFLYLDRAYLFPSPSLPSLESMGVSQFRNHIAADPTIKTDLLAGVCALFQQDRENKGRENVNQQLLRSLVQMVLSLGLYSTSFEPVFIEDSHEFYSKLAEREASTLSLKQYLREAQEQLEGEATRCENFRLEPSTKRALITVVEEDMIRNNVDILTKPENVRRLLVDVDKSSLRTLYDLLSRVGDTGQLLRTAWDTFIQEEGSRIVSDKERVSDMVPLLLNFKAMLDMMWSDPLKKNDILGYSLRETFTKFINTCREGESESNHSKPAEMIAKYVDQVLRSGTKGLPPVQYLQESNVMQDDDAEIAHRLELAVSLFRFIQGKDVFEAFYKKDLAKRLLMDRSASFDAERLMLTKLKTECGSGFTHNLESMFKDMDLSKESIASFKTTKAYAANSNGVDLHVNVLSSAAWPTYPEAPVNLPPKLANYLESYADFYVSKHSGRKLAWRHSLSHCILKADFPKGKKELMLSAFQAVVLLCFNDLPDKSVLTYKDLLTATGLIEGELKRTLQSLALGKSRVLTKAPKGKEIGPDDKFAINLTFSDPKFRVKINQIQLKETKEENKETHERVAKDRQFETQAAITRIMKNRKQATEVELVQAVIEQTKGRGVLDVAEIKKNIERLIDKDYIERVEGHDNMYAYVA